MIDRATNRVRAKPITARYGHLLRRFVQDNAHESASVYTDEAAGYRGVSTKHRTVNHSLGEYGLTNRIESFWSLLKRGYIGVYHQMSPKHLHRYVTEFQERHNRRPMDTLDQMRSVVADGVNKRLRYKDLIAGGKAYDPRWKYRQ